MNNFAKIHCPFPILLWTVITFNSIIMKLYANLFFQKDMKGHKSEETVIVRHVPFIPLDTIKSEQ